MSSNGNGSALTQVSTAPLFETQQFGRVTLPNKIAMAPMTRTHSPGYVPNDENVAYYRRRAEGGVGLIITEGTNPGHPSAAGYPDVPVFDGEEALAGWKRVCDEVHAAGGYIIPQLWHCGSMRMRGTGPDPDYPPLGPSAVVHPGAAQQQGDKVEEAKEMTQQDIDDVIASFARSAKHAEELGFDGAEIHGAHSYLIEAFFWEYTKRRTDKYGGKTVAERATFAVELIEAVREQVSDDFPVMLRFSQWKQGDYQHKMAPTPDHLEAFLKRLVDAGVDWFHCSNRRFNDPEFEGSDLNLAGWTKQISGKPTMTVGSVGLDLDFLHSYGGAEGHKAGLDALIHRLENKEFDMVAVGRALLSDPEWVNKVKSGRESEIVAFERKYMKIYH